MNTPAHLIIAAAAFARPSTQNGDRRNQITWAAIIGSFMPDFSLYFAGIWAMQVQGRSPELFFGRDYFSDGLQSIFAIDNSFFVWGAVLAIALWLRRDILVAASASALMHIALDFPLHHDDGRAHFWPVSDWVFVSPVSYWDRDHYANIVGPLEMLLCLGLVVVLLRRFQGLGARALIALAAAAQFLPFFIWAFVFDG
jgi:hypothetical protein